MKIKLQKKEEEVFLIVLRQPSRTAAAPALGEKNRTN